jgi:integrase
MAVKKRGNGYQISVFLGRDATTGKRKFFYETFYSPTKSLAQQREMELKKRFHKQKIGPSRDIKTVGDLLLHWHSTIAELDNAGEHTLSVYAWHIRRLQPVVGHLNLYDLTAFEVQEALKGQFADVADRTRRNFYSTLKSALRRGFGWGLLPTDVTAGIISPSAKPVVKDKLVLGFDELNALLAAAQNYKHHLVIRLLIVTGARMSEILGLTWQDIDWETGIVKFKKGVDSRRRKIKKRLKTKNAYRSIQLDKETIAYLQKHKHKQLRKRELQSTAKVISLEYQQLVFLADDGRPMRHKAVYDTFQRSLKKAALPEGGPHCLRHSAISDLYDLGIPIADILALSGHANIQSLENYVHSRKIGLNILDTFKKVADKTADSAN